MKRRKIFQVILAALCVLTAVTAAAGLIRLYLEGTALREGGDALAPVFTREKTAAALIPALLLLAGTVILTIAAKISGIKGGRAAQTKKPKNGLEQAGTAEPAYGGRAGTILRTVLFAAAAGLIAAGILNGSMRDVLIKAINLCTECIGLG